jgi:hypothetical protein
MNAGSRAAKPATNMLCNSTNNPTNISFVQRTSDKSRQTTHTRQPALGVVCKSMLEELAGNTKPSSQTFIQQLFIQQCLMNGSL